jgi:hypothetical protein
MEIMWIESIFGMNGVRVQAMIEITSLLGLEDMNMKKN